MVAFQCHTSFSKSNILSHSDVGGDGSVAAIVHHRPLQPHSFIGKLGSRLEQGLELATLWLQCGAPTHCTGYSFCSFIMQVLTFELL